MAQTSDYSDFLTAYKAAASLLEVGTEEGVLLNGYFRKHLRYGRRAAQWPEHLNSEIRQVSTDHIPFTETDKDEIELVWGVYSINPFALPQPETHEFDILKDGIYVSGFGDAAEFYVKYLPVEPLFYGSAYNNTTAYLVGHVVQYSNNYYVCIAASTGDLPTDTDHWRKLAFSTSLLNFIAQACYAEFEYKKDKASGEIEMQRAKRILADEQYMLQQAQKQSGRVRLKTSNSQSARR